MFKKWILLEILLHRKELLQFSSQYFILSYLLYSGPQYLKQYFDGLSSRLSEYQRSRLNSLNDCFARTVLMKDFMAEKYQNLEFGPQPNL